MEKLVEYFNFLYDFSYSHHSCFGLYFKNTYLKMRFLLPSIFTFFLRCLLFNDMSFRNIFPLWYSLMKLYIICKCIGVWLRKNVSLYIASNAVYYIPDKLHCYKQILIEVGSGQVWHSQQ